VSDAEPCEKLSCTVCTPDTDGTVLIAEIWIVQELIAPKPYIPTKIHTQKAHPWDVD